MTPAQLRQPRSLGELFLVFSRLSLQGFGGVLPIAQHELVDRERWLSKAEFLELLSAGQVLPGPNVVNLGLMFGDRCFGWRGALAATAGLLAAPLAIVVALAALYARFMHFTPVAGALRGMGAVAAGLILSMGFKLLPGLRGNPLGPVATASVAVATFAAAAWLRIPLVWIVAAIGGSSVLFAGWRLKQ
jgi:chromate transporter